MARTRGEDLSSLGVDLPSLVSDTRPLRSNSVTTLPNRADQLEASELDDELIEILSEQLRRVLSLCRSEVVESVRPEIDAVFHAIIYSFSVWSGAQTPGNVFQNLIFIDSRTYNASKSQGKPISTRQKVLHGLVFVLLPWLWARGSRYLAKHEWGAMAEQDWRYKVWKTVQRMESLHKLLVVLNLLVFIRRGKFRSVGERVIGMRVIPQDPSLTRALNFDYMNQVLAWQTLQEVLTSLRPIVVKNVSRARARFLSVISTGRQSEGVEEAGGRGGERRWACNLCGSEPANSPHSGACGHVYCYYCLSSLLHDAIDTARCKRCHAKLQTCRRCEVSAVD